MSDENVLTTSFSINQDKQLIVNNSEIIRHTLFSLITVSSLKTTDDYAWSVVKTLLKEESEKYNFLKYISIGNIEEIGYLMEDIKVKNDINKISSSQIGKAIQSLIDLVKKKLGSKAGYFFLQEFKSTLGVRYYMILQDMGVDLRLIELQSKLFGVGGSEYKIKEDKNSNIGFVEKL